MAFFCLSMVRIALELARGDEAWESVASTLLRHFLSISRAMEVFGSRGVSLWDEEDGFFYDVLVRPDGTHEQLPVRSMVGLLPLLAVAVAPEWALDLTGFVERLEWLRARHPDFARALVTTSGRGENGVRAEQHTIALVPPERVGRLLRRMLDEDEFLSPYGLRSLSAAYRAGFVTDVDGVSARITYVPGESDSGLFGGNSNWRGPVWFPVNVLLIDALRTYAEGLGAGFTVEVPTGSGCRAGLSEVADTLTQRLLSLFRPGVNGRRPGDPRHLPDGPAWTRDPTFSEYFHGDTGAGLGASHQTGWTALVAHLICGQGRGRTV